MIYDYIDFNNIASTKGVDYKNAIGTGYLPDDKSII